MRRSHCMWIACLVLSAIILSGAAEHQGIPYWVFLKDKDVENSRAAIRAHLASLPDVVQKRWQRAGWEGDVGDLPVSQGYVRAIEASGVKVHRTSRWLNAVSVIMDAGQRRNVESLPFVLRLQPVVTYRRAMEPVEVIPYPPAARAPSRAGHKLDYGDSLAQWEMVQVPSMHDLGYRGQGVTLCMMDTGFRKDHEVFKEAEIADEYDFVFDDGETQDEPEDWPGAESHGTSTWSLTGGRFDGKLIGGAFDAQFLLAKTEDIRSETEVEEDNWVAALEWADERGADIVSSSLGYPYWYEPEDLDGRTAVTSIAASGAAKRGILIVNSTGNTGPFSQTLSPPSDAFRILAVGAVDLSGALASFSSRGPTADGRKKPEVVACGVGTLVASSSGVASFGRVSGTSLSCPITAAAAATLLSARRDWTPGQLREAIMNTATRASSPDNDYGHGIVQVLSAYNYLPRNAVEIDHVPLRDQPVNAGGYEVRATIRAYWGLQKSRLFVFYSSGRDDGTFERRTLKRQQGGDFMAKIPEQEAGATVFYYLQAEDTKGRRIHRRPYEAPSALYRFRITP